MREVVSLAINGRIWSSWKSVSFTRSILKAASAFATSLKFTDADTGDVLELQPEMAFELRTRSESATSGADLLLTGLTSDDDSDETADTLGLSLNGKSLTHLLIKNSVRHETGRLVNLTPLQIAQALAAPIGVDVIATAPVGLPIPVFHLEPGEKIFDAIERACRGRGLLITDNAYGQLVLAQTGTERNDSIIYGGAVDVLRWGSSRSSADRYTEIHVIGQKSGNDQATGDAVADCSGVAYDKGWTPLTHILTIIAEGEADNAACKARAEWEVAIRSAKATSLSVPVRGWRSPSGKLWEANQLVRVVYPRRDINRDMLIVEVNCSQDESGTLCDLKLSLPSAFTPEPPVIQESSGNWQEDR